MITLMLITFSLFPSSSQDFTAYGLSFGGGVIGERLTNLATNDPYLRFMGGLAGTIVFTLAFSKHIETEHEWQWNQVGRGHAIVFNVGGLLIEHFLKKHKPDPKPIINDEDDEDINDEVEYDEVIEFGLEQ